MPNEEPERMSTCLPFEDAKLTCNKWYDESHDCFSLLDRNREVTNRGKSSWI